MSVFFDLPEDLCRYIVAKSISLIDLARMDVALCFHSLRKQWLEFLPNFKGVCSTSIRELKRLKWMNARNIKVTRVVLLGIPNSEWLDTFTSQWNHITTLETYLADISYVNACSNLTSLTVHSNMDFAHLDGTILSNLTTLKLFGGHFSNQLSAIRLHCRHLTHLSYRFTPTPETNALLVDIFRLNNKLSSVELTVDMELLQLLSPHSKSLKEIRAFGDLDGDAIVYLLENFMVMESITIGGASTVYFNISYDTKKRSLCVRKNYVNAAGWKRFVSLLTDLREITWSVHHCGDLSLQDIIMKCSNALTILDFQCEVPDHLLESLVKQCTALKTLSYRGGTHNWPEIIDETSQLEELKVSGPPNHMIQLLKNCRNLKRVYFSHNSISFMHVPPLICAIRDYRHAETGQPLSHCECTFVSYDEVSGTLTSGKLAFNGIFSGNLWEVYSRISDASHDEFAIRWTDTI